MKMNRYLAESPAFAINLAYENVISSINKSLKIEGLNLMQGLVLTAIFFEGDALLTPSVLAQNFQTSRGNISHIISHLEYKGLVKRLVSEKDARKFNIELRPSGKKKAISLIKYFDELQNTFEKKLGLKFCQQTTAGIHEFKRTYEKFAATRPEKQQ